MTVYDDTVYSPYSVVVNDMWARLTWDEASDIGLDAAPPVNPPGDGDVPADGPYRTFVGTIVDTALDPRIYPPHTITVRHGGIVAQRIAPGYLSWVVKVETRHRFVGFTTDVGGEIWRWPRIQYSPYRPDGHWTFRIGWLWAAISVHYGIRTDRGAD